MYVCTCICVHVWSTCESMLRVSFNSLSSLCVRVRVAAFRIRSVRSRPVVGDTDPIQICTRYGSDTQGIRRLIHEMIRRSVPLRTVKTGRRFDSKTASFHVSVVLMSFSYLLLLLDIGVFILIISCVYLMYFINVITCITS